MILDTFREGLALAIATMQETLSALIWLATGVMPGVELAENLLWLLIAFVCGMLWRLANPLPRRR